ncbi:hypothetical protein ACFL0Q_04410, partial [Thermodesulfobacteriota bacterium]
SDLKSIHPLQGWPCRPFPPGDKYLRVSRIIPIHDVNPNEISPSGNARPALARERLHIVETLYGHDETDTGGTRGHPC